MEAILQGDLGCRLVLLIEGYENELASNVDDANWLLASATLETPAFRGEAAVALTTKDVEGFVVALEDVTSGRNGSASLRPQEEGVLITVERSRGGTGRVSCALKNAAG